MLLARLAELRVAQEAGQVVAIADVARTMEHAVATARSQLLAIPVRFAVALAAEDTAAGCQGILELAIHAAPEELVAMSTFGCIAGGAPSTSVQ